MNLLEKLKQLGVDVSLFALNETALQQNLAPALRALAVMHLKNSSGVVAQGFRGEYVNAVGDYNNFLRKQEENGVWGTYIELEALGEALQCNVVVTCVTKGKQGEPWCLYRATDSHAPTIHLYNTNNTHWYFESPDATIGDGNCLYNACAQAMKKILAPHLPKANHKTPLAYSSKITGLESQGFFKSIIDHQAKIQRAISKCPTPEQREMVVEKEEKRISKLSQKEQQQIKNDYNFALLLAYEEMECSKEVMAKHRPESSLKIA